MPVVEKVKLSILSDADLKELEEKIVRLEKLEQRKIRATDSIKNKKSKGSGIFSGSEGNEALPSSILKKRARGENAGITGGRLDDSTQKLLGDKIKSETEEKFNRTEKIMSALGINVKSKKTLSKDSLVSGAGAPIQKSNEFKKLRSKVGKIESNQKALAQSFVNSSQSLVSGASRLSTPSGIFGTALGASKFIPGIGLAITVAAFVSKKYIDQFANGGTKDTRKKVNAEDVSNIGTENDTNISAGQKLFLSNPLNNQGLPRGNSNTANLRDGTRIYNLRQEGSYL